MTPDPTPLSTAEAWADFQQSWVARLATMAEPVASLVATLAEPVASLVAAERMSGAVWFISPAEAARRAGVTEADVRTITRNAASDLVVVTWNRRRIAIQQTEPTR